MSQTETIPMGQNVAQTNELNATKGGKMDKNYTFEMMWEDLDDGYQIYYTYVRNRYLLFKTASNCYTQKLLSTNPKNPQPKMTMLTLKRVKEMFPHMENIEYHIGISDEEL